MASTLDAQLRERSAPSHETANTNHESRPMYSAGNNRRVAERAGAGVVACGLKVAAFIRWAFSEGTNDRGGRKEGRKEGREKAKDTRHCGPRGSRTCREGGREDGLADISLNSLQKFQSSGQ